MKNHSKVLGYLTEMKIFNFSNIFLQKKKNLSFLILIGDSATRRPPPLLSIIKSLNSYDECRNISFPVDTLASLQMWKIIERELVEKKVETLIEPLVGISISYLRAWYKSIHTSRILVSYLNLSKVSQKYVY